MSRIFSIDTVLLIILITLGVLIVFTTLFFIVRFKKCPADKILVVYGYFSKKNADGTRINARYIHGGAIFVWPLIQGYQFLDLHPINSDIKIINAYSRDNIAINLNIRCSVAISTDEKIVNNAIERLLGMPIKDIEMYSIDICMGVLRMFIANNDSTDITEYKNRDRLMDEIVRNIEAEINKIGLKMVNFNILELSGEY